MGKLSLSLFALGVAACGSDNKGTADAGKTFMDAPPKVFMDAPPKVFMDAPPVNYDFTCFAVTPPATAASPVTIAGTTETLSGQALAPLGGVTVETFKTGDATALDTKTSDATLGTFTTGNLVTGDVPLDSYIKASFATYRTTYLFPPNKVVANLAGVPVPLISDTTFGMITMFLGMQNDDTSGVLLVTVTDCALMPITGAMLTAKEGNTNVTITDLSQFGFPAFVATNVLDGDVTLTASYNSMTFPVRTVHAYKKPTDANAEGTITSTAVVPGPF